MPITVDFDELQTTLEWLDGAAEFGNRAYISRETGKIHWVGDLASDAGDEPPPDDVEDAALYAEVPSKRDFDLGRPLVFAFAEEQGGILLEQTRAAFSRKGAYRQFRRVLEDLGKLDAWYAYEEEATVRALQGWLEENGFVTG